MLKIIINTILTIFTLKEAYVGKSIVMKRFRPRAKGRASAIKKPFSRITIILGEKKETQMEIKKEFKKEPTKTTTAEVRK